MEYLLSFSHEKNMEDIILYHVLKPETNIFWIDVGANDPVFDSVTKFFSVRGGGGINIEPQPLYAPKYAMDRPNDINLMIGISDVHGEMKLHGKGESASFDVTNKHVRGMCSSIIPVWTLKEVCDRYIQPNQTIHLLKIDVEGWEKQCLKGMDFKQYRPWILCLESDEPSAENPGYVAWENIVTENGYLYVGRKYANRYYVLTEKRDIINRFQDMEHLENYYDVTFYSERERYEKYIHILQGRALLPLRWVRRLIKKLAG